MNEKALISGKINNLKYLQMESFLLHVCYLAFSVGHCE